MGLAPDPPDQPGGGVPGGLNRVLRTKLTPPRAQPRGLERAQLVARLNAELAPGRVGLVVAPAGWGKSGLLGSWLAQHPARPRCAWFSADGADNDPGRFWTYVLAALTSAAQGFGEVPGRLLSAPGTTTLGDVVPALLNELAAQTEPIILIVDDYQSITHGDIQEGVALLVERMPPALCLVIAGRSQPTALPIARWRGRGRLVELTATDLALTPAETAELLARELPTSPSAEDAARLHERTEGWIAGLHLAALSLRRRPDPHDGIADITGDNRDIGDYLAAEVLAQLPSEVRRFLRRTAVLERLSAPLCNATLARADSAALLARIEHEQLFLIPLDEHRQWYRYHHLFADVLRRDLEQTEPALTPDLRRRAADWFAAHALPVEAVAYALAGDDPTQAAELVAAHSVSVCLQGQVETVLGWFAAVGDDVCRSVPRLGMARALVAGAGGHLTEMDRWAHLAEVATVRPGVPPETITAVQASAALSRWASAYFTGNVTTSVRHARAVLQVRADDQTRRQGYTALGWSLYRQDRVREAQAALTEATLPSENHDDDLQVMVAFGMQAIMAAAGGRHADAEAFAAQAERSGRRHSAGEHFNAWCFHFARGWVAHGQEAPDSASDHFQRALELLRRGPMRLETAEVLTALAMTDRQLGNIDAARRRLDEARSIIEQCPDPGCLLADPRTVQISPALSNIARPVPALTQRESEILALIAAAGTNQQVADHLGISVRTVHAHLRSIYRKIGVTGRVGAARYALNRQDPDPDPDPEPAGSLRPVQIRPR
jgi:LuxR family maltose regulon positive regulatory protein